MPDHHQLDYAAPQKRPVNHEMGLGCTVMGIVLAVIGFFAFIYIWKVFHC
jgi:hypothetical protein